MKKFILFQEIERVEFIDFTPQECVHNHIFIEQRRRVADEIQNKTYHKCHQIKVDTTLCHTQHTTKETIHRFDDRQFEHQTNRFGKMMNQETQHRKADQEQYNMNKSCHSRFHDFLLQHGNHINNGVADGFLQKTAVGNAVKEGAKWVLNKLKFW